MWLSALTGLLFLVSALHASPLNDKTDINANDEDEITYVLNLYAVRGVKSKDLGKMLSGHLQSKMPLMFEPIGSILVPTDETELVDLGDVCDDLENRGIAVDRVDDEDHPTVIEIKFEYDEMDFMFYTMELQMHLLSEGIIINVDKEDDEFVIYIELDESVKNVAEHSLRLEGLGEFMQAQGYPVEYVRHNGQLVSITIKISTESEESDEDSVEPNTTTLRSDSKFIDTKNDRRIEMNNGNGVEVNNEKKANHKVDDNEELDVPLDFITRSDSLNKIRRRRSACPECKAGNLVRQYLNNHPVFH